VKHEPSVDTRLAGVKLRDYRPRSMLRLDAHHVGRARFPVVDIHNHLGRWLTQDWSVPDVEDLLRHMDRANIETIVNLDGRLPGDLTPNLDRYDRAYPGRFLTFCQLDWRVSAEPGFGEALSSQLREAVALGARGLKVWKDLGLHLRDGRGALLATDDERLDPLWAAAAEVEVPVLIHTADPVAFFDPLDETNERLEELIEQPDWWVGDRTRFPTFDDLIDGFERLIARHPDTTFVGAHMGCYAEDLGWVNRMLTTYPNFHVDIAARIAELGRQPRAARALIMSHPDRVLFGTDELPPSLETYRIHFRFLETADEHFPYSPDPIPGQGRWAIYGLDLPDDVLRRVYADNARRILRLSGSAA
jgi:predicted TIM-barrel fold metal-dependent hydrolase